MTTQNKQLVQQALNQLFQQRNLDAIDQHFAADYQQHNPFVGNGPEGLRTFASQAIVPNPGFTATASHVLADGELVAVRSRYTGFGPNPHVGFDLFRIQGNKIAEHWDCLQEDTTGEAGSFGAQALELGAGNPQHNRALIESFLTQVLIGQSFQSAADFLSASPGTAALQQACTAGSPRRYLRVHRVVAEGNLVVSQAEGSVEGRPHALYDLFRISDGKIVGHWGAAQEVVPVTASGLGMF